MNQGDWLDPSTGYMMNSAGAPLYRAQAGTRVMGSDNLGNSPLQWLDGTSTTAPDQTAAQAAQPAAPVASAYAPQTAPQPTGYAPAANLGMGAPGQPSQPAVGSNPYLGQMADEIGRRSQQGLGQSFNAIRSNSIGVGGYGGSRQGVAQGVATGMANDAYTGNLANLFGTDWTNSANRDLSRYQGDQAMYSRERQLDQTGAALGADLYSKGQQGQWTGIQGATGAYSPFTGLGTSTQGGTTGGGWGGAVGGALGTAQLWSNMNKPSNGGTSGATSTGWW